MKCFITKIEDYTFKSCRIKNIIIPSTVRSIGNYAFYECSLQKLSIPSSVKSIGDYAFGHCIVLKEIEIPTSVKSVGDYAFANCYELKDLMEKEPGEYAVGGTYPIYLLLFFVLLLCIINFIAVFITTVVWWSRIHPWFSHGYKTGKIVYKSLETSWISSLITLLSLLFILLSSYMFNRIRRKVLKRKLLDKCSICFYMTSVVVIFILVLIVIISAMIASSYALKKEKIDGVSIKCLRYIFDGCEGAKNWVYNQSLEKQNKFNKWVSNMNSKAYKSSGDATNYYCILVGVPIMIFSILLFLTATPAFILLVLIMIEILNHVFIS